MELAPGPLTNGRRLVRALAVLTFATGLALSGARVVGTRFEPVLLVPGVLAVFIGWLLSRLPFVVRVIGQVAMFVGSSMAVAYAADGTSADFGRGLLDGPRQVVTTAWPSPRFPTIFVALAALIFVASAVSIDLAMRLRWRALAIAPMVVALIALIAVGAPDGPQWQAVLVAATASFALLWIGLDDRVASIRSGVLVAVSAGLAALLASVGVSIGINQPGVYGRINIGGGTQSSVDAMNEANAATEKTRIDGLRAVPGNAIKDLQDFQNLGGLLF